MKTILLSLLLLSLSSFSGCNRQDTNTVQPLDPGSVLGQWQLSSPKTTFTITLDITQKTTEGKTSYQLSGLSPVNQYGADATIQADGTVTVSSIVATKRGGSTEAMNAESAYFKSLQQVDKAELVGGKLQLRSRDTNWTLLVYDKR
jgi:heat shock protein HslJ